MPMQGRWPGDWQGDWQGDVSPQATQGGARSLLAFWMGGAGAPSTATQAGVRSMLAPWAGGAGAVVPSETTGGPRSLLAFWIGGAGAQITVSPPAPPSDGLVGWRPGFPRPQRLPVPPDLQALRLAQLIDDDELLLLMAAQIAASGLLH